MSAIATADPVQGFRRLSVFSAGGATLKASKINDDGSAFYENVPIFRSGTFKDSLGYQHTYEPEHMAQAVFHYDLLKGRGTLTPPVREDHSMSITKVIGYFDAMRAEAGERYTFLNVDFTVTRPEAVELIENGTYRFRSAEVGYYETNDEALYWPVVQGFAFVDMPAVEGLDGYAADRTTVHFSLHDPSKDKEPDVGDTPTKHEFTIKRGGQDVKTSDYAAVQAMLDEAAKAPAPVPAAKFRIDGSEVVDPAKVQQHIDVLEAFRTESVKLAKDAFVDTLASKNIILATQVDDFKAHVAGLDGPGFDGFKALYANALGNPLVANHAAGDGSTPPAPPAAGGAPTERETLEETIVHLRRSGLSDDQIEKTDAYKRLQALTSTGK